jgi:hypothetical protein
MDARLHACMQGHALMHALPPPPHQNPHLTLQLPIWDHLEELRERVLVAGLAALVAIVGCFCYSKVRCTPQASCAD